MRQLKVRQPLAGATVPGPPLEPELEAIVMDELNLKSVTYGSPEGGEVVLDIAITPELRAEGLARDLVRRIQESRKLAGYSIEDRIEVRFRADQALSAALREWSQHIAQETLAVSLEEGEGDGGWFTREMKVEGEALALWLRPAGAR